MVPVWGAPLRRSAPALHRMPGWAGPLPWFENQPNQKNHAQRPFSCQAGLDDAIAAPSIAAAFPPAGGGDWPLALLGSSVRFPCPWQGQSRLGDRPIDHRPRRLVCQPQWLAYPQKAQAPTDQGRRIAGSVGFFAGRIEGVPALAKPADRPGLSGGAAARWCLVNQGFEEHPGALLDAGMAPGLAQWTCPWILRMYSVIL